MNIAIITWFKGYNYGTKLQAYALQAYLKKEGHNVDLINYSTKSEDIVREKSKVGIAAFYRLQKKIKQIKEQQALEKKKKVFLREFGIRLENSDEFLFSSATMTKEIATASDFDNLNNDYDVFICGSDQIWNPQILNGRYYLNFVKDNLKIAYAASTSVNVYSEFQKRVVSNWISNFYAIGVRESKGTEIIRSMVTENTAVKNVCDPTLLLPMEHWKTLSNPNVVPNEKYFLVYFIGSSKWHMEAIDYLKNCLNIKFIILPMTAQTIEISNKEWITYGPREFLALFENAEFVLTDSFHAMMYSLIYKKQFSVLLQFNPKNPYSQDGRLTGILNKIGLLDRIVKNRAQLNDNIYNQINYDYVSGILDLYIKESKDFLRRSLNE